MGVTFSIKVESQSNSKQKAYKGKDGKAANNVLIGALTTKVSDITGRMIVKKGIAASKRTLWLAAIYFQRLVSRTPRDEPYKYVDDKGYKKSHVADDDFIQDYWTAKYWNYKGITAKYLRKTCGCTFNTFNDQNEIKIIYKEFENRFFGAEGSRGRKSKLLGKTTLKGIRIYCDYPKDKEYEVRFSLLEFGGYIGDGIIKNGDDKYHGVVGGKSIQAPKGMVALTEAEYNSGQFTVPGKEIANTKLIKNIGQKQNITDELKKIIGSRRKLTADDIEKIMELYGV